MTINVDDLENLTGDDLVVSEAKKRFDQCLSWESGARQGFLEDIKFANADSINCWQWPNEIRRNRDIEERPVLTVNKTHQHCLQIINEAKQNPTGIKIRATGSGSTHDSAEILESVCRRIEYMSNAQAAYEKAIEFQVYGGIGYWRVVTDYADDDSLDQEIFIRRIKDPLNVFLDPNISEIDGSDARFGFVFDDMPKDEFKSKYPDFYDVAGRAVLGNQDSWMGKDFVRVAEYFRAVDKKKTLVAYTDPKTEQTHIIPKEEIPSELFKMIKEDGTTKTRDVTHVEIEWYLIAGDTIIEKETWPGKYIPIVRLIGEETIIAGELDRKGHTRALRDPQRIYNYWTSSAVEHVALQSKIPYKAAAKAIEGYETYWETANRINYSVLPYNHIDDNGNVIEAPQRESPPQMAQAYVQGMQIAAQELMMVSGQYQASMGAQSNETSGKAIDSRQRQGENSTYHFIANQGHAIRYTGKIMLDLIPKIYDTKRVMKIMSEDGTSKDITVDPTEQQAYVQKVNKLTKSVQHIFNPNVGKYSVEADIGPAYGTRRLEAFNAFNQLLVKSPQLVGIVGDLMFQNADFPGADEIADRLRRLVPPQALGTGPSPQIKQMQAQIVGLQKNAATLIDELAIAKRQLKDKGNESDVNEFKAITERLKALLPTMTNPRDVAQNIVDAMTLEKQNAHTLTTLGHQHAQERFLQGSDHSHQQSLQSNDPEAVPNQQSPGEAS